MAKYPKNHNKKQLMVWDCIWSSRHRQLGRVQGSIDNTQSSNILKSVLAPSIQDGFVFQQDKAACRRS